jgi:hypothetical protein
MMGNSMKLKSKLRLALELGLVTSALPLLLLGCGGGGGGSGESGMMSGQFWTDLTGTGLREFQAGNAASGVYVLGYTTSANFSGGRYIVTGTTQQLTASGVWSTLNTGDSYYLANNGWTLYPSSIAITATDETHYSITDHLNRSGHGTITTINLSGTVIVASSAVPAIDHLGQASSVSPAFAFYPAGSYEFDVAYSNSSMPEEYVLWGRPDFAVTTIAGSITSANFDAIHFAAHATTDNPICVNGMGLVYTGPGSTRYSAYALTLKSGVAADVHPTCLNASIASGASVLGTYDLTFTTLNTAPIVTFTNISGYSGFANYLMGVLSNTVYGGSKSPARAATNATTYGLNKTAMDAALQAWGVPVY